MGRPSATSTLVAPSSGSGSSGGTAGGNNNKRKSNSTRATKTSKASTKNSSSSTKSSITTKSSTTTNKGNTKGTKKGSGNISGGGKGGEIQVQKSPAEFFADNQAIAGFDNLGKALYTSIRELMENSLDACESIGVLPTITVAVEELTIHEFNAIRGISSITKDTELFHVKGTPKVPALLPIPNSSGVKSNHDSNKKKKKGTTSKTPTKQGIAATVGAGISSEGGGESTTTTTTTTTPTPRKKVSQEGYFCIKVRDNGCGMAHDKVPDLLGRVLSGSKYGVRQTRGKFGLGAKMALIWSKKSTGVPIKVTTSHRPREGMATPKYVSWCVLDIDITNNCPRIMEHSKTVNTEEWVGTQLELLIAGNWTTYKSRVVQYLQQLAIITPYAQLELLYENRSDPKKNLSLRYDRRSEQMPPLPREIKHHPSSVNNIIVHQLIERSNHKTLVSFLTKELSSVTSSIAKRIVKECGWDDTTAGTNDDDDDDDDGDDDDNISDSEQLGARPSELTDRQITKLVQVLRTVQMFRAPDGSCLSPLGEYNLNLGIRKVLEPDLVATARDKPSAYEGHPFVVEAAVSLGGKDNKEGINVVRFANRIPLLFEAGADVCTRVATNKIKWSSYKIDHKRDKIGVFVSIVSTKIPYKGTGKEYIGDDITEISFSVKRALQTCCQQLRIHLQKRNALRDQKERKNKLSKYIPDVSRSLYELLEGMKRRHQDLEDAITNASPRKRPRLTPSPENDARSDIQAVIGQMDRGEITPNILKQSLEDAVALQNSIEEEEEAKKSKTTVGIPLFLKPLFDLDNPQHDIEHPFFTFRPTRPVSP
jgi:DNA topoisomerase-6 subunit B